MKLVCIHGNSLDKSIFDQVNVEGFDNYTFNLPGHGNREIGQVESFSDLVDSVYEEIKSLENVVLLGVSLGGHIAHHLLAKLDPLAVISISAPPLDLKTVSQAFMPNPLGHLLFQENIGKDEATELADSMLSLRKDSIDSLSSMITRTNPLIRGIIGQSLARGEFLNEVELLLNFQGKKLLIIPQSDRIINQDYVRSLSVAHVIELPGNHLLTMDNPQVLNELLNRELYGLQK